MTQDHNYPDAYLKHHFKGKWVNLYITDGWFWKVALGLQIFFLIVWIGWNTKSGNRIVKIVSYYCMIIMAQWKGVINVITRKLKPVWEKAESTR